MNEPDDRAAVDRAFAELVAGFHVTADRPDPSHPSDWDEPVHTQRAPGSVFEAPEAAPAADESARDLPEIDVPEIEASEPDELPEPVEEDRYDPGPIAPLPRPTWPILVGWIGIGYAVLTVLVGVFGFTLPRWAAWAGVVGFAGGFGLLLSQLPRHRPPDAGDGAVL